MNIQQQVDHLIDTRPGRELLTAVYDDPAHPVVDGLVYRSGGNTAAYMILTDHGRVIVNTGMGYEAPHHKRVFDAIRPGPTHHIITTQAHVDHVGGVDLFREPGTTYIAQANNPACQADDRRIQGLRMRTAGIWFDMLGTDARRIAAGEPGRLDAPVGARRPTSPSTSASVSPSTGCASSCSPRSARPIDCCVVWLPEHRVALVSNLFGPLFPHFPNLNTIRGDKYRFVEPQLATNRMVRELRPEVLVTGRHDPIVGADLIEASLERLHDAVTYVHDRSLEGFNAGTDVWTLMREIRLPARAAGRPGLRQGVLGRAHALGGLRRLVQARSRPPSSTPTPPPPRWPSSSTRSAPTSPSTGPRRRWPAATRSSAIRLGEAVEAVAPDDRRLRSVMAGAHRHLLDHGGDVSFWEHGWLRTQLARWDGDVG